MSGPKKRKARKRRSYGKDIVGLHAEEGQEGGFEDIEDSQESMYKVPPNLAPYALTRASQIPPSLRKYWKQRWSLFSYFDGSSPTGMLPLLDEQSWFSVTPEPIAARISQRCQCNVILDAYCGAGGNAIQFALTCQHVVAIDIDPVKLLLAKHNAEVYGVKHKITFLLGDWRDFVKDWTQAKEGGSPYSAGSKWMGCEKWKIDVVFLSPPWGGIDYREPVNGQASNESSSTNGIDPDGHAQVYDYYPLSRLEPTGGEEMFHLASVITSSICMYLPRTIDLNEVVSLIQKDDERAALIVEVEEQWLSNRCKAVACYFGDLIESGSDGK
jgi:trimethylguanosine synthase